MSARVRLLVRGHGVRAKRRIGRMNVYRVALASWYGPGLYGRRTGCGGTLGYSQLGVAHKSLPCGTKVTLRHHGRRVRVPVIDRGPYVGAREYDLTAATARKLRFHGHGGILTTR
jgi:rare lipoprotein A